MPRFVKERLFGGFADIPGDHNNPECTHVLLTKEEYVAFLQKIEELEREKRDITTHLQGQAREMIRKAKEEADYRCASNEKWAQEKVQQAERELEAERQESAYQRSLNQNLLRIAKERSNADRRLRPKKEHTGYVVVSSVEKEYKYKDNYRNVKCEMLWETVLQSPYTIDWTEEQVRCQMQELFQREEDGHWMISKIGINSTSGRGCGNFLKDDRGRQKLEGRNVLLERRLRANYRVGYWEMILLHTKPLGIVPKNMRIR